MCVASKDAKSLAYPISEGEIDKQLLSEAVDKYGDFFKMLGIYTIVGIVLTIVIIIIGIIIGIASISSLSSLSISNFF